MSQSGSEITRLKWPPSSLPYLPLAISLRAKAYSGKKRQAVADEDLLARFFGRFHDLVALGSRQTHRLFDEDVLAGLQRGDRRLGVQIRRQADIDQVDRLVGEQVLKIGIFRDARLDRPVRPAGQNCP